MQTGFLLGHALYVVIRRRAFGRCCSLEWFGVVRDAVGPWTSRVPRGLDVLPHHGINISQAASLELRDTLSGRPTQFVHMIPAFTSSNTLTGRTGRLHIFQTLVPSYRAQVFT